MVAVICYRRGDFLISWKYVFNSLHELVQNDKAISMQIFGHHKHQTLMQKYLIVRRAYSSSDVRMLLFNANFSACKLIVD